MIDHKSLEEKLNNEAKHILTLIKSDYYDFMSPRKKYVLDRLLESDDIVVVNQGKCSFDETIIAHGGRALKDGKIHFYPDCRKFSSDSELIDKCMSLLPHEIFHYFLQPDRIKFEKDSDRELARFYTEGLVEREARKFCENHPEIIFEKANYGYNINFVNTIQNLLGADSYDIIFSENDYIRNIEKHADVYNRVIRSKKHMLELVHEISKDFPENLQRRFFEKARTMVLQDGNANAVKEKLKSMEFVSKRSLERIEESDELEL